MPSVSRSLLFDDTDRLRKSSGVGRRRGFDAIITWPEARAPYLTDDPIKPRAVESITHFLSSLLFSSLLCSYRSSDLFEDSCLVTVAIAFARSQLRMLIIGWTSGCGLD